MISQAKFAVVLVMLFAGAVSLWWWGLADYRETARTIVALQQKSDALEFDVKKMRAHIEETERVLQAVESIKAAILAARERTNEELENSRCYIGVERLDRLERLLEEDYERRRVSGAAGDSASGLRGASGAD